MAATDTFDGRIIATEDLHMSIGILDKGKAAEAVLMAGIRQTVDLRLVEQRANVAVTVRSMWAAIKSQELTLYQALGPSATLKSTPSKNFMERSRSETW